MLVAGSAVIFATWVSVCAAAPEYIWQGLVIAFKHPSLDDVLSALLLGLILAFFVEPLTEHVRRLLHARRAPDSIHSGQTSIFFSVGLSLTFAVASVCLHDAMSAFLTGRNAGPASSHSALVAGLSITIAWAIVPFAVTMAWLAVRNRWLAVPLGLAAAVSSYAAGWAFSWTPQGVINTTIPCLFILTLGYRGILVSQKPFEPSQLARTVAIIAAAWLMFAVAIDVVLGFFHANFRLYGTSSWFWTDLRFYIGWCLGLLLAPASMFEGRPLMRSGIETRKAKTNG
jgi:hypothetical protein